MRDFVSWGQMITDKPPHVQYVTRYCALLQQDVEVVLTQRAEGSWALTHCREKHKPCDGYHCPLRTESSSWPFEAMWW